MIITILPHERDEINVVVKRIGGLLMTFNMISFGLIHGAEII